MTGQKQALVTTGATVTFEALIRSVLQERFLDTLAGYGYGRVVVQYGRSEEAIALVKSLLQKLDGTKSKGRARVVSETTDEHTGRTFEVDYQNGGSGVSIECIQFDVQLIEKFTRRSDLVISHAGTGSIMDTLRVGTGATTSPRLIVVVNEGLQDNHQREIAHAFESLGVVTSVGSGEDMVDAVVQSEEQERTGSARRTALPAACGAIIETIVAEEM